MRPIQLNQDQNAPDTEFNPDSPEEIEAMLAMLEYLLPQAREVSPTIALHLGLAKHELVKALAFRKAVIERFPCIQ
ncbi:hypothetical protein [Bosea sp. ASV33]|uniref:hypothetical protein n=1 Tax=Bosea sp. ASV33 TaxID=2795106 RepID=UPI0018ECBB30|nr:hypothetical protein [Bosea sp. ASV33]